jgi:hypothetical protein
MGQTEPDGNAARGTDKDGAHRACDEPAYCFLDFHRASLVISLLS